MLAVDTNVLVRILVQDDKRQARAALRRLQGQELFIGKTVLVELVWVLESVYELDRNQVSSALSHVTRLEKTTLEDPPTVRRALEDYTEGADFADAIHVRSAPEEAAFVSFDRALVKKFATAEKV